MKQNFINTTDKSTADKLILNSFKLVSHIGSVYTFLNDVPSHFQFEEIDKKQIVYSNILSI